MTIDHINVEATIKKVQQLIADEEHMSSALRATLEVMIMLIQIMANRLSLTSRNSSKPPSTDRFKDQDKDSGDDENKGKKRKRGGQFGRIGTTLQKVDDPDEIEILEVDRATLPPGNYQEVGFEIRQVFDIEIQRLVTEYRAQVLEDQFGKRFTASFPVNVTKAVQYGNGVKAQAVYLSQYQLIPYQRVQEQFQDQFQLPISVGSIFEFNQQAYHLLEQFELKLITKILASSLLHADETGININGKNHWLHCISNQQWTLFYAHAKRGMEAITAMNVLTRFTGILCHDHWKPYFQLNCLHALCNAHHLRELTYAEEQESQAWAKDMRELLVSINEAVKAQGGVLSDSIAAGYTDQYRAILKEAEQECPPPLPERKEGQRGRLKRSKSRNLLERLINFEQQTLRFMTDAKVPFTNNQGENDIRMTKVHQKISGCFRSQDGADIFCRVRSYLSTCRKNNISASEALTLLFDGKLPDFIQ